MDRCAFGKGETICYWPDSFDDFIRSIVFVAELVKASFSKGTLSVGLSLRYTRPPTIYSFSQRFFVRLNLHPILRPSQMKLEVTQYVVAAT
jgi:hypothetical protein